MRKNLRIILFLLVAVIQLFIPAQMILSKQLAMNIGQEFKFRVEARDPYDPFRGRYLRINVEEEAIPVDDKYDYIGGQRVFVLIDKDTEGFARIAGVSPIAPSEGVYIKTKVNYVEHRFNNENSSTSDQRVIHVVFPFDRYYMPETQAPLAEKVYNEKIRDTNAKVYVTVRILNGDAVLDRLFIDDETIEEFIKKHDDRK